MMELVICLCNLRVNYCTRFYSLSCGTGKEQVVLHSLGILRNLQESNARRIFYLHSMDPCYFSFYGLLHPHLML